ncbi:MAG TPA: DHHA1 domain-containing protein, partial [Solirubrobacteraceae bacterium]
EGDFEELMEQQRERGRAGARTGAAGGGSQAGQARAAALAFAGESGFETQFTGYETEEQHTTVGAVSSLAAASGANGDGGAGARFLVKLAESPFYAAGGGQIADVGTIECAGGDCRARVEDVFRLGDDQALAVVVEDGSLRPGEPVLARVDHLARHATEANHTATHLLQAALREVLGPHVRQAGSYVGPDKLRFDFSHGQALTPAELLAVEDLVNGWIARNDPVRPITTTLDEARGLGAMALFGEKYGEVVRMVEIGGGEYSRELCGGTHVHSTAEIGPFRILHETSSSANVRRIEALTGPAATALLREHDRALGAIAAELRTRPEEAGEAVRALAHERKRLEKVLKQGGAPAGDGAGADLDALASQAQEISGAVVLTAAVAVPDAKALLDVADRMKGRLGAAAILLGTAADGRVHLVASVAPELVERGVRAGSVVQAAAEVVGGGGGGRDTMAQAGGRDPERLDDAIAAAHAAIESALG